ncbi:L7Ae/L30e/S12e/Gadd45 family ribosomal protein [Secundilactobacillus folii]|uniref:Ribosomal protein eL8/eL30/eS12/Gadd45 domain-containing protein n=1 Tax=Secundilactobacillus folii TaxID=2678357 RepID=A0A7X2XUM3_9LACO|nr:ribosomal L7Ae/L30e/S12e/Gadd45 family protein [Secundilactobacillus folii]MTV81283.1 hypothetical protein [Secundilactobacillus folii]
MARPDAFLQLLGLVRRANQLVSGEEFVLKAIRAQSISVAVVASDTGASSLKKLRDKATFYHVDLITTFSKEQLSQATGMNRTAYGVKNPGFARKLIELVNVKGE